MVRRMSGQGRARIEFEADATKVSDELVRKMTATMERIASILERGFQRSAQSAQTSMSGLGDAMDQAARRADAAAQAGRRVGDAASAGAQKAQSSTGGLSGAFDRMTAGAERAGQAALSLGSDAAEGARRGQAGADALSGAMSRAGESASRTGTATQAAMDRAAASARNAVTATQSAANSAAQAGAEARRAGDAGRGGFDGATSAASLFTGSLGRVSFALGALMGPLEIFRRGWERVTGMQEAEIRFRSIGVEGQKFTDTMSMLNNVVSGTSASLNDAATQASMLMVSGVQGGDDLKNSMEAMVTAAAVGGKNVGDMGLIFQQVAAAGKLQAGDALQLSQASVPIWTWLSKSMGKSIADVRKMSEEGKISYQDMVEAIRSQGGSLAKDMGNTFRGEVSKMGSAMARLGAKIAEPVMNLGMVVIPAVAKGFDWLGQSISEVSRWMEGGSGAATAFGVALKGVGIAAAVGTMFALVRGVSGLVTGLGLATKAINILKLAFVSTGVGALVVGFGLLVAGFITLWQKSEAFRDFWKSVWDRIKAAAEPVITWIRDAFTGLKDLIVNGDFTGALARAFHIDEDSGFVAFILKARDAIADVFGLLAKGDLSGILGRIFGVENGERIAAFLASARDVLWDVAKSLGSAVWDAAKSIFSSLADVGKSLFTAFKKIAGAVWDLIKALSPILLPVLKIIGGIVAGVLIGAFFALMGALKAVAWLFEQAAKVISWLADNVLSPLIDVIGEVVSWLVEHLAGAISGLIDTVKTVGGALGDFFTTVWEGLQAAWDAVGKPVVDFIAGAFAFWWDGIKLGFRILGAAFEVVWTALQKAWDTFGQPVLDFIVGAFNWWWSNVQVVWGWVRAGWDMLWNGVRWVYDNVIAPVVGWIVDRFNDMKIGVGIALDIAKSFIQSMADKIREFWDAYVAPVVDWVTGAFRRIAGVAGDVKDKVVGAFASAGRWLWDSGRNIVQGLIDGVKSLAGAIGSAFLDTIPGWIKDPFKRALGIASPSKVFAGFGVNIGEGLLGGLASMTQKVSDAATGMGMAAVDAAQGTTTLAGQGIPAVASAALPAVTVPPVMAAPPVLAPLPAAGSAPAAASSVAPGPDVGAALSSAGDAMATMAEGVASTATEVLGPTVQGVGAQFAGLGDQVVATATTVVQPTWDMLATGLNTTKTMVLDPMMAGIQGSLAATGAMFPAQAWGTIVPAWQGMGGQVMAVKTGTIDPAFAGIQGGLAATTGAFAAGATGIANEWSRVREATAAPVRFTIGSVFNDGLVGMWNSVSDMLGTSRMNPYPINFATGGPVRGPGGPTEDRIPAMLSDGEFVMSAAAVDRIGVRNLNALNNSTGLSAASGALKNPGDVQAMLADATFSRHARRLAGGGVVEGDPTWQRFKRAHDFARRWNGHPYVWGGSLGPDNGTDCSGYVSSIADVVHGGSGLIRKWATGAFPGGGGAQGASGPQGFVAGLGAGMSIGVSTVHTAGTLGGIPGLPTVNVESGGSHGNVAYAGPATGADDSQFPSRYHLAFAGLGQFLSGGGGGGPSIADIVSGLVGEKWKGIQGAIAGFGGAGIVGRELPGKTADKLKAAIDSKIADAMATMGGDPGGAGAERWRSMVMRALAFQGLPVNPAEVDAWVRQIGSESSGIPDRLQQITDINGTGESAGVGLLQIIPGTFAAHRDPRLPDDRKNPWSNINAAIRYGHARYGDSLLGVIGHGHGYDQGGIASGKGLMAKKIIEPERVLNPAQTKAFEAWMAAGQNVSSIQKLIDSLRGVRPGSPDDMAADISKKVTDWMSETTDPGDVRSLLKVLESGVEWDRVTDYMHRSAEAWANGDWVKVADDKRLATPEEMGRQVAGNAAAELADELGSYVGVKGLVAAPKLTDETGLVTLPSDTATPVVAAPDLGGDLSKTTRIDPAVAAGTTTQPASTTTAGGGGEKTINVEMTINVNGVQDPMTVKDRVMSEMRRGLETAIGGQVRAQ